MEKAKKIGSDIVNKVNDIANNMSKMKSLIITILLK